MRTLLFFLLFSTSTLSACTCAFMNDFCSYAASYFGNSDTSAVLRYAKFIEYRNPEVYSVRWWPIPLLYGGETEEAVTARIGKSTKAMST